MRERTILLIAESVQFAAIRTLPGDPVARHAPEVFLHAVLADFEAASAAPAEGERPAATLALLL